LTFCVTFVFSVTEEGRWLQQNVGYCPQFDALFNELTPVEHLHLFARIRGIPEKYQKKVKHGC